MVTTIFSEEEYVNLASQLTIEDATGGVKPALQS